jgi:hypothetical protein
MGKKHKYTKHEFIDVCCSKCKLCDNGASPDLCYSEFYTKHPKKFIKQIFKSLLETKQLIINKDSYPQTYAEHLKYVFKKAFCTSNICNKYSKYKECNNIYNCLNTFRRQINGYPTIGLCIIKKRKKQRYIVKPYPTFFTNDSEVFREEIKKILDNMPIRGCYE